MRYRIRGPGSWDLAYSQKSSGGPGDWYTHAFGKVPGTTPGEVPYDGTFRLAGLGDTTDTTGTTDSSGTSTPSWLQNLVTGATQFVVGQQQMSALNQLNQINMQRAAAGLPPLPASTLVQPGVQVGLSPDLQNMLLFGGLGIAALWAFGVFARR